MREKGLRLRWLMTTIVESKISFIVLILGWMFGILRVVSQVSINKTINGILIYIQYHSACRRLIFLKEELNVLRGVLQCNTALFFILNKCCEYVQPNIVCSQQLSSNKANEDAFVIKPTISSCWHWVGSFMLLLCTLFIIYILNY